MAIAVPAGRSTASSQEGVTRIEGPHCYAFYAGEAEFAAMMEAEPGTFFLTDFLARHFDRLVIEGLGLDRFPQLRDDYFGNYRRLVYLAQTDDPAITERAEAAARRLGLAFERRFTGLGGIERFLRSSRGAVRGGEAMANLTILYWRDIPSQVIVKSGRNSAKRELSERFIRAIDAAAMRAHETPTPTPISPNGAERSRRLAATISKRRPAPPQPGSRPNTTPIVWPNSPSAGARRLEGGYNLGGEAELKIRPNHLIAPLTPAVSDNPYSS